MSKKRLGWGLTISWSVFSFFANLIPVQSASPTLILPLLFLISIGLLSGLFIGHILLIWHYSNFFKHWVGFVASLSGFILLCSLWFYFNNTLLVYEPDQWLSYLNLVISIWLMVSVFSVGIVIFIFLIVNDYGLRVIALTLLGSIWGLFFLAQQMEGDLLFENILKTQILIFSVMQCLTMWLMIAGLLTFGGRMFWLTYKELSADIFVIEVEVINE